MTKIILKLIRFYQATISPDHGPQTRWPGQIWLVFAGSNIRCRFYPSCSQYTVEAIEKLGAGQGLVKGFLRILKCNPFFKGGIDPA